MQSLYGGMAGREPGAPGPGPVPGVEIGRVFKKHRELLIQKETVCVSRFIILLGYFGLVDFSRRVS